MEGCGCQTPSIAEIITSMQKPSNEKTNSGAFQRWRKIASISAVVYLVGAIVVCLAGSPDFRATIQEWFSTLTPEPGIQLLSNMVYFSGSEPNVPTEFHTGDLYLPESAEGNSSSKNEKQPSDRSSPGNLRPAIVVVHGGSWSTGSKNDLPETMIARYFARHGIVAFSINYRMLGHGGEFPADVVDTKRALVFLVENAAKWRIDPARLIVTGTSSGAYAAMMAAYTPNETPFFIETKDSGRLPKVRAVLSFYGPTEFDKLSSNKFLQKYLQKDAGSYEKKLKVCSPITYSETAVPTFFAHGTADQNVPIQQSIDLARALGQEHIPCELVRIEGADHFVGGASRVLVLDRMMIFLDRILYSKSLQ